MDVLATKLDKLENDNHLSYVLARADVNSDKAGYEDAGVSRAAYYKWPKEIRDHLNKLARELKLETALKAKLVLKAATKEAAEMKVSGLKSGKEHVQQSAATEILDRMLGKPTQRQEVEHDIKKPVTITHILKHEEEEDE